MFTRKIIAAISTIIIICSLNFCEASKKIVAVMPLENVSGYEEEKVAEIMTEQLIVAIHSSGGYTVVERRKWARYFASKVFKILPSTPAKQLNWAS